MALTSTPLLILFLVDPTPEQDPPTPEEAGTQTPLPGDDSPSEAESARTVAWLSPAAIRSVNRRWSGFGVGLDTGLWGQTFGQSIKLSIPFGRKLGRYLGLRLRGALLHHEDGGTGQYDPVINLGGELFGRGPVWGGILRSYGGGGLWVGIRPNPTDSGATTGLGGGGFFGLEVMAASFMSFTFEVGGQAPGHALGHDAGASVTGGLMFYFGRSEERKGTR